MTEKQSAGYLLAVHGDIWSLDLPRMQGYLNTLIVSDMSPGEIEERTQPRTCNVYMADGSLFANGTRCAPSRIHSNLLSPATPRKEARLKPVIVVLPLIGPITQRESLFTAFFGGTSTEKWGAAFDELVQAPNVGAIVIEVSSPGGEVSGVPELAAKIYKARGTKPIVAVANAWAASAAYWLAAAADELIVSPSGMAGSIGVWSMHISFAEQLKMDGVEVTLISAGKFKTEFNPFEPLDEEAKKNEQAEVDRYYGMFVNDVAKFRGVTSGKVRNGFGEARLVGPDAAITEGMADRKATLEQTIRRLGGRMSERASVEAAAEERERELQKEETELAENRQGIEVPPA